MKAALDHSYIPSASYNTQHGFSIFGFWHKLIAYAKSHEEKRFMWAAISLVGHGTFFTIVTMASILLTTQNMFLIAGACFAMVAVLIVNLAALPLKYLLPAFVLSLLTDLLIIATTFIIWFN